MRIGIFFMVDGVVIHDALPIEQGERYGDCVEYGAHYDYWLSLLLYCLLKSLKEPYQTHHS